MKYKSLTTAHLHWLLLSLGTVLAIHAINLPIWVTVTGIGFGIWRYLLNKKHWALPKMWVLIPIILLMCLGILLYFSFSFGRDASMSLLILMCALKLLETKTLRDYMLIIAIAYFLIGSVFVFNQSVSTFLLSLLPLIVLTTTLIQTSLPQVYRGIFAFKLAGKMLLQALPLMLVLFILFPRLPGPVWGLSRDANNSMTGLNDQLELGDVGNLTKNSSVAFRVQFERNIPPSHQLYWRGPVLWQQSKNKWLVSSDHARLKQESLDIEGAAVDYTITLEPHNRLWLLMLDMPSTIPDIAKLRHDYTAIASKPVRSRIRYQVTSHPQYILSKALDIHERNMALKIDKNDNPKSVALANSWSHLTHEQIINQALQLFNQQAFIYTLKPPPLHQHAIDEFLFTTKKGFCEHYASSFVYLMRAAGVPARIITGYQGGELNPNGNYLIVRQSDAHAWAEVWLQDKGWVRIDPTAAVSPERIEQGIEEAVSEADELPMMVRQNYPWIKSAYLNWDYLNNGWNQWILGYDDQKQLDFLKKLSGKNLSMYDIAIGMITAIILVILITALILLRKTSPKLSPVELIYAQYLRKLRTIDLQPRLGEGAQSFAYRTADRLPEQQSIIMEIAKRYNALQYSKQPPVHLLLELEQLIQQLNIKT
ncbi:MAG: transglutaminaseTgpA domain-containing protein [Methylophilus sp.]